MSTVPACVELPDALTDGLLEVQAFGATIKATADISKGFPDQCSLSFDFLGQLKPIFATLGCLFKLFTFLTAILKFASSPFTRCPDLLQAFEDVRGCVTSFSLGGIVELVKSILDLLIKLLECIVEELRTILTFRLTATLDLGKDDALDHILGCSIANADLSLKAMSTALQPITQMLGLLSGLGVSVPDLGDPSQLTVSVSGDFQDEAGIEDAVNQAVAAFAAPLEVLRQARAALG